MGGIRLHRPAGASVAASPLPSGSWRSQQEVYVYRGRVNSSGENVQEKGVDVSLAIGLGRGDPSAEL